MHVGRGGSGLARRRGTRPGRDHGVAQLRYCRLRCLFGEAQIPLPRLPRALVSAGGRGTGDGRRGGGRVRSALGADAACGFVFAAVPYPASGSTKVRPPSSWTAAPCPAAASGTWAPGPAITLLSALQRLTLGTASHPPWAGGYLFLRVRLHLMDNQKPFLCPTFPSACHLFLFFCF